MLDSRGDLALPHGKQINTQGWTDKIPDCLRLWPRLRLLMLPHLRQDCELLSVGAHPLPPTVSHAGHNTSQGSVNF